MMLMSDLIVYCMPGHPAVGHAAAYLKTKGIHVADRLEPGVTHLLLPVPTRSLGDVPEGVVIVGGNLPEGPDAIDLLKDPEYLAMNAAITARCAIGLIGKELEGLPVLVLGWGRIGKCLGKFLGGAGAKVTIAARKAADVAMIRALGYESVAMDRVSPLLPKFGAVLNTVPAMVLPAFNCAPDCVLLELASKPGMAGNNITDARGLPGKYAPKESGELIARRFLALVKEEQV